MKKHIRTIGRTGAVLSHVFCLVGGIWIVAKAGLDWDSGDAIWTGMGLYFIGKAFFVGPMLWIAAEQLGADEKEK